MIHRHHSYASSVCDSGVTECSESSPSSDAGPSRPRVLRPSLPKERTRPPGMPGKILSFSKPCDPVDTKFVHFDQYGRQIQNIMSRPISQLPPSDEHRHQTQTDDAHPPSTLQSPFKLQPRRQPRLTGRKTADALHSYTQPSTLPDETAHHQVELRPLPLSFHSSADASPHTPPRSNVNSSDVVEHPQSVPSIVRADDFDSSPLANIISEAVGSAASLFSSEVRALRLKCKELEAEKRILEREKVISEQERLMMERRLRQLQYHVHVFTQSLKRKRDSDDPTTSQSLPVNVASSSSIPPHISAPSSSIRTPTHMNPLTSSLPDNRTAPSETEKQSSGHCTSHSSSRLSPSTPGSPPSDDREYTLTLVEPAEPISRRSLSSLSSDSLVYPDDVQPSPRDALLADTVHVKPKDPEEEIAMAKEESAVCRVKVESADDLEIEVPTPVKYNEGSWVTSLEEELPSPKRMRRSLTPCTVSSSCQQSPTDFSQLTPRRRTLAPLAKSSSLNKSASRLSTPSKTPVSSSAGSSSSGSSSAWLPHALDDHLKGVQAFFPLSTAENLLKCYICIKAPCTDSSTSPPTVQRFPKDSRPEVLLRHCLETHLVTYTSEKSITLLQGFNLKEELKKRTS